MPLQIIDVPPDAGIFLHPAQHINQLLICKMMTKERRKNNIGLPLMKYDLPIICMHPIGMPTPPFSPRPRNTLRIIIHTDDGYIDTPPMAVTAQYPQIITPTTPDFTNRYPLRTAQQPIQAPDTDPVPTQPGIDKIQFMHILLDIRKRDIIPIQQLLL